MNSNEHEEFYVGYLPKAPDGITKLARRTVVILLLVATAVAIALIFGQGRFAASFFEYGNVREYEGVLRERPVPRLLVEASGAAGGLPLFTQYALVAEGKHGAATMVAGLDGKRVHLRGTRIHRDEMMMIEVVQGSVQSLDLPATGAVSDPVENLGTYTLAGEIVDSKCYLGVMNPGHTKPHRECAVRCISGGIPPLLIVRDAAGNTASLWLSGVDGESVNRQILDMVAEPVEITGSVTRRSSQLCLSADPKTYRRLSSLQ